MPFRPLSFLLALFGLFVLILLVLVLFAVLVLFLFLLRFGGERRGLRGALLLGVFGVGAVQFALGGGAVLGLVDLAVDGALADEVGVLAHGDDLAAIHDDDLVRVHQRGDALGDDDLRHFRPLRGQRLTDHGVGLGIDGAGGIVEDQHLRLFEQRAGDAEALALAAGDVRAALLDVGIVLVGELLDEVVRLRQFAGVDHLFIGGVRVAPAQVVLDGAGEEDVLLQHHGHGIAQRFKVVLAHVHAADEHAALGDVVKAGNELHQRPIWTSPCRRVCPPPRRA